jgi:hypothetical protein
MIKRNLIQKILPGGFILIIQLTTLQSCLKDKTETNLKEHTYTIDLTDSQYAALTSWNGFMVIASAGLIVDNSYDAGYNAADCACTFCSSTLDYVPYGSSHWTCHNCNSFYNVLGEIMSGPATTPLKVYRVTKTGNILTIHLDGK